MCVTTYISYLAYKLFHNQFSFMLGKHENTFPLLAGCKIALFLYHLLTKRMLYLHSCSSVDPALAQEPGYNWQLEFKMRSWMLPLYTCITCVCTANKQTLTESRIWLQKYWFTDHSLTGVPASQCCCQTNTRGNKPAPTMLALTEGQHLSQSPVRQKFVTQEVIYSLVSGVTPTMGTYLLL